MKIVKYQDIVEKIAQQNNISYVIAEDIIKHAYSFLLECQKNFTCYPIERYRYLGRFFPSVIYLRKRLHSDVKKLRSLKGKEEYCRQLEKVKKTWRQRTIAVNEKERRKFKKRFGEWHYKKISNSSETE